MGTYIPPPKEMKKYDIVPYFLGTESAKLREQLNFHTTYVH
jgi:hypothetical protein